MTSGMYKQAEEIERIVNLYVNGNKKDFREAIGSCGEVARASVFMQLSCESDHLEVTALAMEVAHAVGLREQRAGWKAGVLSEQTADHRVQKASMNFMFFAAADALKDGKVLCLFHDGTDMVVASTYPPDVDNIRLIRFDLPALDGQCIAVDLKRQVLQFGKRKTMFYLEVD